MRTPRPAKESKSVKIPADLYYQVKEKANREGRLIIYVIAKAIENYLKANK